MKLEFWSSSNILLLVIATLILVTQHASAASYFRNESDRLALLHFKHQISDDPNGVLNSWNDSHNHCRWEGISCDARHGRVTSLTLRGKSLFGSLSPYIGNLSFLKSIQLGGNRFHGEIPQEVGRLFRLKNLNLSSNTLSKEIPVNLSHCLELTNINLKGNQLVGKIPTELSSLKKLVFLNLGSNNLTGGIPRSFGNLSSLRILSFAYNILDGNLPNEIGLLRNLSWLSVDTNKLTGTIHPSLYNISTMSIISLTENSFYGNLPNDIGLKMPNLRKLNIATNHFHGNIPVSIINATELEELDLPDNKFEGPVPNNLGDLPNLKRLNLGKNLFGRNAIGDLDFVVSLTNCSGLENLGLNDNSFGGQLPHSIGNLSLQVREIYMGSNRISGSIPIGLTRLTNLYLLGMEKNLFSGSIPMEFGNFPSLQGLNLVGNMLSGRIPSTLWNISTLYILFLQNNNFEGTLPPSLGNCQSLRVLNISGNKLTGIISPEIFGKSFSPIVLDLSHNSFIGSLPQEVGKLININTFLVSYNSFSGPIPETLGDCSNMEELNMKCNFFQGTIPPKLSSLKGLQYLDLSENNLSGQIPREFERLLFLEYLNLSFNDLEGNIPTKGVFANSSGIMLEGNTKICGGIPQLQLPSCLTHRKKNWKLFAIIGVPMLLTAILIFGTLLLCSRRRVRENNSSTMPSREDDKILRISYHELQRATSRFSPENLVGSGSFGVVYKGRLDEQTNRFVAIKVLNLQKDGASRSFKAECNALRNIRHRNLVSLLTYCSSIDYKGQEFTALVYEFMENGNLDMWLHPEKVERSRFRTLTLLQRLNIAFDVAAALQYLHSHCGTIIVHCDLKPSNILLDNDFTAHVGDFGLARFLPKATKNSSGHGTTSSFAIKGSIGYTAPEYAMGCEVSTQGDVYSYGILLLEMFTGKRPTDDVFGHCLNLHNYVRMNLLENVMEILDPFLLSRQGNVDRDVDSNGDVLKEVDGSTVNLWGGKDYVKKCIISILKIGLKCSETSPNDRIQMNEVTRQLQVIRDTFLRGERDRAAHDV